MTSNMTRAEQYARIVRERIQKRNARRRIVQPLPMDKKFWHDLDLMHLRCEQHMANTSRRERESLGRLG